MPEKDVIFISWSGKDTASFRMAEILYKVLPVVFQSAECFLSDDIDKGTIGINEILVNLSKAKIGIICVTKANIEKTWLNFEAGALASAVFNKNGRAITLLIDMTTDEYAAVNSPIRNLQATILEESDLLKMFMSINKSLGNPLKEEQVIQLFDNLAKKQILECDTSSLIVSIPQENKLHVSNDSMTKDCKKFFKALYSEYAKRRKEGVPRSEAIQFNNSQLLSELLSLPFDDVECCSRELHKLGFLKCNWADNMVFFSTLTEKGIKYGENYFDEPTYIQLLRLIIDIYTSRKAPVPSDRLTDYSSDDVAILKSKGFIVETSKYLNGKYNVKPTDEGISKIALMN